MAQCPKCGGAGRKWVATGVGWNSDFYERCSRCNGTGYIWDSPSRKSRKAKDSKKGDKAPQKRSGRCFIATAAFGDPAAPEVIYLSAFRDDSLSQSALGRSFIRTYYAVSPKLAIIIAKSDFLRSVVRRFFLQPIIFLLKQVRG